MGRGSSVVIATRYGADGRGIGSRVAARFSATFQTGLGAHPAFCTMGAGSWPLPPTPSRAEVKERVELHFCFVYEPS